MIPADDFAALIANPETMWAAVALVAVWLFGLAAIAAGLSGFHGLRSDRSTTVVHNHAAEPCEHPEPERIPL